MLNYAFKALSKSGKEMVIFKLEDGPCPIDSNYFMLAGRPGTPLLRYDSIMMGSDLNGVFSGDIVEYKGKEYCVSYNRGFALRSMDGDEIIRFHQLDINSMKVIGHELLDNRGFYFENIKPKFKYIDSEYAKAKRLKSNEIMWGFKSFFGTIDNKLIVNVYGVKLLIPCNSIQQYTGFSYQGKPVYFNDSIKGSPVYMKSGRVYITQDGMRMDLRLSGVIRNTKEAVI